MMITMIVNQLTSFSETDDGDAYFQITHVFYVEGVTHAPTKFNSFFFINWAILIRIAFIVSS